jgi:hypothetical protein
VHFLKNFKGKIARNNLLLLAPLPFLAFHAFIFVCWYLRSDALDVAFVLGSLAMLLFSLRLQKYLPIGRLTKDTDHVLLPIWLFPHVLELMFWYGVTATTYYVLWSQFDFPLSLEDDSAGARGWKPLALGYGLFFLGTFIFGSAGIFVQKALSLIKADFEKVLYVVPRIASVSAIYLLVNVCFAVFYRLASIADSKAFNRPLDGMIDALYFSTITISTLGYGDVYPKSTYLKLLVSIETLLGIALLAAVLSTSISVALSSTEVGDDRKD